MKIILEDKDEAFIKKINQDLEEFKIPFYSVQKNEAIHVHLMFWILLRRMLLFTEL